MNKFAWAACALILSAHAPAMAQTAVQAAAAPSLPTADRGLFTAQDLFGMEVASDAQISPDGGQIAYVRQTADIMTDRMRPTIWLIDVKTGRHSPLIASAGSHRQPRWSPDGQQIAYLTQDNNRWRLALMHSNRMRFLPTLGQGIRRVATSTTGTDSQPQVHSPVVANSTFRLNQKAR